MKKNFLGLILLIILVVSCNKKTAITPTPTNVLPVIGTNQVSNITTTTALSGGTIYADSGAVITAVGVCWSTNTNPTILDNKTQDSLKGVNFYSNLTGLLPNTQYHIRAYAINASGTAYGNDVVFTTINPALAFLPKQITVTDSTSIKNYYFAYDIMGRLTKLNKEFFYYSNSLLWPTTSTTYTYSYDSTGLLLRSTDKSVGNISTYTFMNNYIARFFDLNGGSFNIWNGDTLNIDLNNNVLRKVTYNGSHSYGGPGMSSNDGSTTYNYYTYNSNKNPFYGINSVILLLDSIPGWMYSKNLPASETYNANYYSNNATTNTPVVTGTYSYTTDSLGRITTQTETFSDNTIALSKWYY